MIYEDRDYHVVIGRDVGADPTVAAAVVRRIVAESARQADAIPAKNDHRVIGFFMAKTQLTMKVRIFGPTPAIRKMNSAAAELFWTTIANEALDKAIR
jgi:hypothetical protein